MILNSRVSLTVVTPALNCGSTLAHTLESLGPLRAAGAEHIVVDSGSTDRTIELAQAAGAKVIRWPKGNMYAAINEGLRHASGEWITYINGDDLLYGLNVLRALSEVPDSADFLYGNIDLIAESGMLIKRRHSPAPFGLRVLMCAYSAIPQQGTFFRRRVYESMGGFDESFRFSADYDYWSRGVFNGFSFHRYESAPLAGFRLWPSQLSKVNSSEMAAEGWAICRRNRRHFASPWRFLIPALGFVARRFIRFI